METMIVLIGGSIMFVVQMLCFRIKKPWGRWIPLGLILLGGLYCVGEYFGVFPWNDGYWNELSAAILAIFLGCISCGAVIAWIAHILQNWVYRDRRK